MHLIQAELFDELELHGFQVQPGDLGDFSRYPFRMPHFGVLARPSDIAAS
ncbi:hypothetical protein QNO08_07945 [Arthrobacter sp. zg-Y820]|nr:MULTISPECIES: hypothetical protein [unclassified Arthrobacter]MCC9196947.1 hypothetical protein [Arthrobacter sp. zg-Y820]MDK1279812.1 hypothetical protein [Arthrobacter sp. zg.Y820]WIB10936.1 hypothetical protein QNO08_07945 [Arthrobacter sp. zg-Y820]